MASVDAQAPRRQWRREPSGFLAAAALSCDQSLVRQPSASRVDDEAIEPGQRVVLDVALIQPERKLINVPPKVLRGDVVKDAVDPALQDREDAFDAVDGDRRLVLAGVARELADAVVDGRMAEEQFAEIAVSAGFVGVQRRTDLDVPVNFRVDGVGVGVADQHADRATAALTHSQDGLLADRAAPLPPTLRLVLIGFQTADKGFVDFNDASQLGKVAFAGFAQPTQDEPCGFLRDADLLGELHRRDALARGDDEIHRIEPLVQRNVRPLEDGPGANREILPTGVAAVEAPFAHRDAFAGTTDRAARPGRPEAAFEVHPSRFLIGEHLEKLKGGNGAAGHRKTLTASSEYGIFARGSQVYKSPSFHMTRNT